MWMFSHQPLTQQHAKHLTKHTTSVTVRSHSAAADVAACLIDLQRESCFFQDAGQEELTRAGELSGRGDGDWCAP